MVRRLPDPACLPACLLGPQAHTELRLPAWVSPPLPGLPAVPLSSFPGGNVHTHYQEEKCYEDGLFFYHLGCHQWVSGAELAPPGTPEGEWPLCFPEGLLRVTLP